MFIAKKFFKQSKHDLKVKFNKRFFKPTIEEQIDYKDSDIKKQKKLRNKLIITKPDEAINAAWKKYEYDMVRSSLTTIEIRTLLFDFEVEFSLKHLLIIQKIIDNSKELNRFVFMYYDIDKWIKYQFIKNNNIVKGKNDTTYLVNGEFDNRLMNTTMVLYDVIWNIGINLFREAYLEIYRTNKIFDYYCNLLIHQRPPELEMILNNLMKCSSLNKLNNILVNSVNNTCKLSQKDNSECRKIYKNQIEICKSETREKIRVLFDVEDENDIEIIFKEIQIQI
jgi:hypothetical protein